MQKIALVVRNCNRVWVAKERFGCSQVLQRVAKMKNGDIFAVPVTDDVAPNYSSIIQRPMDLSTLVEGITKNKYQTLSTTPVWLQSDIVRHARCL